MAEQIRYVIGVDISCPEPGGEGVPQVVEVEITDSGLCDCLFKTDHQLTASSSRPHGVEDAFIVGRILAAIGVLLLLVLANLS